MRDNFLFFCWGFVIVAIKFSTRMMGAWGEGEQSNLQLHNDARTYISLLFQNRIRIKNRRFFLTFERTHTISFATVCAAIEPRGEHIEGKMRQQLETAINLLLQVR